MASQRIADLDALRRLSPSYRTPPAVNAALDIAARPLAGPAVARGKRYANPALARREAAGFAPRPFALDATRRQPRIHPGALLSAVRFADFLVVSATGAAVFFAQTGTAWPLGLLPA